MSGRVLSAIWAGSSSNQERRTIMYREHNTVDNTTDSFREVVLQRSCSVGIAYSHDVPQPGMAKSHHKSDAERYAAAWHAAHCRVEDCDLCQSLCDHGSVISCDDCGRVHHTDWLGWAGAVDGEGRCAVWCPECRPDVESAVDPFIARATSRG